MSCCGNKRKVTTREVFLAIQRDDVEFIRKSMKSVINMVDTDGLLIRQHKLQITELSINQYENQGEVEAQVSDEKNSITPAIVNGQDGVSAGEYLTETQRFFGCTPLMFAASLNRYEICSLLRHQVGCRAASGEGALFFAAARGYIEIVELILEQCEQELLFTSKNKNITCLMAAAEAGHVKIVELLVSRFLHKDKNSLKLPVAKAREAVLSAAQKNGSQLQVTENPNSQNPPKPEALLSTLPKAQLQPSETQLLTQKTTDDGFTALMLAVAGPNPNVEVTEILAPYEATLYTIPHYTALMLCIDTHTERMMQILEERQNNDLATSPMTNGEKDIEKDKDLPKIINDIVDILIKHDECKKENSDGLTALMIACQVGNTPIARKLLPYEATMCRRSDNLTPLMVAANAGNEEIVKMLIDGYKNDLCGKTDTSGWTALTGAVHAVSQLYQNSQAYEEQDQPISGTTIMLSPQSSSSSSSNKKDNATSISSPNTNENIPVQNSGNNSQFDILSKKYINIVRMLIPYEAGIARRDGSTGLMLAAETGYVELASLLVEKESGKFNVNSVTSLMLAAVHNRIGVAKIILRNELRKLEAAGFDVLSVKGIPEFLEDCGEEVDRSKITNLNKYKCILDLVGQNRSNLQLEIGRADKNDLNAIMLAIIHNHQRFALMLAPFEAGTVRTNGLTSTILAVKREMSDLAMDLTDRDNLEIANESGITALILASNLGMTEVVRKMVSMGEKGGVGKTNSYGKTALIVATMNKKVDIVEILAPYEIDIKDKTNLSALDYARRMHSTTGDEVCQKMIDILSKAKMASKF